MHPSASEPPSVLHIVWNAIRGGTEGQCARVVLRCPNHGVALFRREGFFLDALTAHCGEIHEIRIQSIKSPRVIYELWRLSSFIKQRKFQWVHAWDADAAVFGAIAARGAGVPLITSRRDLGDIYARWKLRLMDRADLQARSVVVNADAIKARRIQAGIPAEKIVCVPNILDLKEFDTAAQMAKPSLPAGRWMGLVARLDAEKDIGTAIRALSLVRAHGVDIGLVIAGEGPERAALEKVVVDCGVSGAVMFLGDTPAIPALLQLCEVGVLTPSANEGLSNTLLEYMAAGLPVVATDCGGNRELVEPGVTGFVVPIGDAAAVAAGLLRVLEHGEQAKQMGRNGRQRVQERHRPEIVVQKFRDLYNVHTVTNVTTVPTIAPP